ncbi:MAG TPA: hypothetical protein PK970_05705 [Hyphomicrobiaceae bacterium]|nr:hypothetical protein [Hyphomicrobiaceae bacterium]
MTKRGPRAKIGDVARVVLPIGCAHIQYVGKHENGIPVIRVGSRLALVPSGIDSGWFCKGYFALYHFPAALSQGLIERVGTLPAPEVPQRWRYPNTWPEGRVTWQISGMGGYKTPEELTAEEVALPVVVILSQVSLIHRLLHDWRPEKFVRSEREAYGIDPAL